MQNNLSFSKDFNLLPSKVEQKKKERIPIYGSLNQSKLKYNA